MKIVISTDIYYPMINGVAVFSRNLATGLKKRGHQVMVLAPSITGEFGVEKDEEEAVKWYRKAAKQDDPESLYRLGLCYEKGIGVKADRAEAIKWYRKAASGYEEAEDALKRLGVK